MGLGAVEALRCFLRSGISLCTCRLWMEVLLQAPGRGELKDGRWRCLPLALQVVDEIYDQTAAEAMGITRKGQVWAGHLLGFFEDRVYLMV